MKNWQSTFEKKMTEIRVKDVEYFTFTHVASCSIRSFNRLVKHDPFLKYQCCTEVKRLLITRCGHSRSLMFCCKQLHKAEAKFTGPYFLNFMPELFILRYWSQILPAQGRLRTSPLQPSIICALQAGKLKGRSRLSPTFLPI